MFECYCVRPIYPSMMIFYLGFVWTWLILVGLKASWHEAPPWYMEPYSSYTLLDYYIGEHNLSEQGICIRGNMGIYIKEHPPPLGDFCFRNNWKKIVRIKHFQARITAIHLTHSYQIKILLRIGQWEWKTPFLIGNGEAIS